MKNKSTGSKARETQKALNLFDQMGKSELWYGLLPEFMFLQRQWLALNGLELEKHLGQSQLPYMINAISLWEQALNETMNGRGLFACHVLRSILERTVFLWATCKELGRAPEEIIRVYASTNRKDRRRLTDELMALATKKDPEIELLYDEILSRYYNHVSHLDGYAIDESKNSAPKWAARAAALPTLHVFDVGVCLGRVLERRLSEYSQVAKKLVAGRREANYEYDPIKYVRAATHVLCERHTEKSPIELGLSMKNVSDIGGDVGFRSVYRGGMLVTRFGDIGSIPHHSRIAGLSMFCIGSAADRAKVKVKLLKNNGVSQDYRVSWPKDWDLTSTVVAFVAHHPNEYPLFDYVTEFLKQF